MREQVFVKTNKSGIRKKYYTIAFIVGVVVVCIGCVAVYFYYWSPALRVREFSVIGTDMSERAKSEIIRYFDSSRSFFSPATDRIVFWVPHNNEVIESPSFLPYALSVKLMSNLQEKKVTVEVTPRVMSGVWCTLEKCYAFDDNGIVFASAPDISGSLILKIKDENNAPVTLGERVLSTEEFHLMKRAIQSIQENKIPISEILIQNRKLREWSTIAPNGFSIKFSFDSVPEDLTSLFHEIFERVNIKNLTYIDFRVPNRVYYK